MSRGRIEIDGEAAFTVPGALRDEECWALIEEAEEEGFDTAPVRVGLTQETVAYHIRSCFRVILEREELAARLWARLGDFLPGAHGINPYFRVFRYDVDQRFLTHRDGVIHLPGGLSSAYTLLVYLNGDCQGGETRLHLDSGAAHDVVPEEGLALLFEHDIAHEGVTLEGGVKYVVRSEVLYAGGPVA